MAGLYWSLRNHYLTTLCIYRHLETHGSTFEEEHLPAVFLYIYIYLLHYSDVCVKKNQKKKT